jgi:hypothetical protein
VYLRGLEHRWNVPTCGLQIDANRRTMEPSDLLKLGNDLVALDRVQDIKGNEKCWDRVWNGKEFNHLICVLRTKKRVRGFRGFGTASHSCLGTRLVLRVNQGLAEVKRLFSLH